MKEHRKETIIGILALILTTILGIILRNSKEGIIFDVFLMDLIHKSSNELIFILMKLLSFLGSVYLFLTLGLAIIIYMINKRERRYARLLTISIAGSFSLNALLKIIISRTRPLDYMLIEQSGYSFPSGHSMVSMSFYTTLTYIILSNLEDERIKKLLWIGNFILVGLIGFSRIYLGVHWPTDVIAGFILGYILFYISKIIVKD